MNSQPTPLPSLLTPTQAAQRLLEGAILLAYRTNGAAGIRAVRDAGRVMYRLSDIDGLIKEGHPA